MMLALVLSTVSVTADASNPELSESCGIDIVLVLDSSDSLNDEDIQDVKDAANSFVDALLPGTPTNIGVVDFDTNVISTLMPTNDIQDIKNAINSIGHIHSMEYTNWEAAISEADLILEAGDLMVIITDGKPTRSDSGGSSLSDAVAAADVAKTNGIRIVAIGIDSNGINGGLNVNNLKAISGPNVATVPPDVITVDTDVILGDISGLGDILSDLTTALCGGTITVQKFVDGEPAKNWEFTVDVTGGTADPSFGFTDDNGYIVFDISIGAGDTTAYVDITEIQQGGYSFVDAIARDCSGQICTDNGIDSLLAIPVTQNGCPITCIFNNTDSNDPPSFGIPDPVNGSSGQDILLTWSINIEDPDGNAFDWSIECSNGQPSSGTGESNGTKTLALTGLSYSTTYTVWVNATDAYGTTEEWFTFTTSSAPPNSPPIFSEITPSNGSTDVSISTSSLSVIIQDPDGDDFNWTIECSNGQSNGTNDDTNGTKELSISGLDYGTTYTVWVNATDAYGATEEWFIFTTRSKNIPTAPDGFTASANGCFQIDLSWTDNGDDLIYIEWNTVEAWSRSAGTEIYNDTGITYQHIGLDYGTQYFYQAWSYNVTDNTHSSSYAEANDTTATSSPPSPPPSPPPSLPPPLPSNDPPIANASASETFGFIGTLLTFNGSLSTDDGSIESFDWDFGDNNTGTGEVATHSYSEGGTYTVTLTVTDSQGATDSNETIAFIIQLNRPPTDLVIGGLISGGIKNIDYVYNVVSTDPDNDSISYFIDWGDGTNTTSEFLANGTIYSVFHNWTSAGTYEIKVSAMDENNATSGETSLNVVIGEETEEKASYILLWIPLIAILIVIIILTLRILLKRIKEDHIVKTKKTPKKHIRSNWFNGR